MTKACCRLVVCLLTGGCGTTDLPDGRTRAGLVSGYELVLKGNDQNGDEKLSRAEIQVMVDSSLSLDRDPAPDRSEMRDWLLQDYAAQDLDQDGYLTLNELLKEPLATFTCIDANRDGFLSQSEIEAGMGHCGSGRAYNAS